MDKWWKSLIRGGLAFLRPVKQTPRALKNWEDLLSRPEAVGQVRLHQEQSATLPALQVRLRARFEGTRCIIIGSAPGLVLPPPRPGDQHLCANGSIKAAFALGIDEPELTTITGHATNLLGTVSQANVQAWQGRKTGELIFVENGDTVEHARQMFADANFRFGHFTSLNAYERAAIIREVTGIDLGVGERDDRISMGAFAAVLAMWGNAVELVFCGFSLNGGHSYINDSTPRHHVAGDSHFFERLRNLPVRASSTSVELQRSFCLPPPA